MLSWSWLQICRQAERDKTFMQMESLYRHGCLQEAWKLAQCSNKVDF